MENYVTSEPEGYRGGRDGNILKYVANKLGRRYFFRDNFSDYHRGALDFDLFLKSLEALYEALGRYNPSRQEILEAIIKSAISESEVDLGIQWRNGAFWPSRAKLLDTALVNESLDWLSAPQYSNVLVPFEKGLRHFLEAHNKPETLADTITDMYEALEAIAKVITGRNKDLSGNREAFISNLGLSSHYGKMLRDHIDYANQYRHGADRHGAEQGKTRGSPLRIEVEAFIYHRAFC